MKRTIYSEMYEEAGYREKYAIEHGNKATVYINGHKCFKFTYNKYWHYQDANGAAYDTVAKKWIN